MSEFHFVNHSGFILRKNNVKLAVDPWISGPVFNNSWDLLVDTPLSTINELKKSNYVWFSHEHPDHFNPSNLNIFNNNNNFIFQKTKDKRVVDFLKKKISINVKELQSDQFYKLDDDFYIKVIPFQYLDSMCLIKIDNMTILNLNDCDIKKKSELEQILKLAGNIDILMLQFSYAIGKSNKTQINIRKELSLKILKNISNTIKFLKPKITIPFASFCFFSRRDNFYLNDSINKIEPTINYLKKNNPDVNFYCFYPGDKWNLKDNWSNEIAFKKYEKSYSIIKPLNYENKNIDLNSIKLAAKNFISKTKTKNNLFFIYKFLNNSSYKVFFRVTDLNISLFFDFDNGLTEVKIDNYDYPYCELSSESLYQLFSSGYGYDALIIGGRFESNNQGLLNLNKIFNFQAKNYQNIYYNFNDIFLKFFKKIFKTNNSFNLR